MGYAIACRLAYAIAEQHDLLYRLLVDAPEGESTWALPSYYSAINDESAAQVWCQGKGHFHRAYAE